MWIQLQHIQRLLRLLPGCSLLARTVNGCTRRSFTPMTPMCESYESGLRDISAQTGRSELPPEVSYW